MIIALILGVIAGVVLKFVPEGPKGVILDGIAAPIMSTVIDMLMAVMGPVLFLFMIVSISSLRDMENCSKIGKAIIRRCVITTVWITLLTIVVASFFFPVIGGGDSKFGIADIVSGLLNILPKNLISPFTECNIPQIILLGIVFGAALLMMGDSGKPVKDALAKVKEWVMSVLMIMMRILLLVPFISAMMIVAKGNTKVFVQGWKYIAAAYMVYLVSLLIEFIAISVRCKKSIGDLAKTLKDIVVMAFVTAMPSATIAQRNQVSEKDLHIGRSFADLWIDLSAHLLSPARTISLVLSAFFIADVSGNTIDVALMIILIITAIALSLASSGTVAGATVMLESLKLPTEMVGLFSAFEIFTGNAGAAYDAAYSMLEELDVARETGNIKEI